MSQQPIEFALVAGGSAAQIYAPWDGARTSVTTYIEHLSDENERAECKVLIDGYADSGADFHPLAFPSLANGIFAMIPGNHRMLFFLDRTRIAVITHCFPIKRYLDTPHQEIKNAASLKGPWATWRQQNGI